eukprot:6519248-Pyramimonas_sp.AAC.1
MPASDWARRARVAASAEPLLRPVEAAAGLAPPAWRWGRWRTLPRRRSPTSLRGAAARRACAALAAASLAHCAV